jgi:hypothetical protein
MRRLRAQLAKEKCKIRIFATIRQIALNGVTGNWSRSKFAW